MVTVRGCKLPFSILFLLYHVWFECLNRIHLLDVVSVRPVYHVLKGQANQGCKSLSLYSFSTVIDPIKGLIFVWLNWWLGLGYVLKDLMLVLPVYVGKSDSQDIKGELTKGFKWPLVPCFPFFYLLLAYPLLFYLMLKILLGKVHTCTCLCSHINFLCKIWSKIKDTGPESWQCSFCSPDSLCTKIFCPDTIFYCPRLLDNDKLRKSQISWSKVWIWHSIDTCSLSYTSFFFQKAEPFSQESSNQKWSKYRTSTESHPRNICIGQVFHMLTHRNVYIPIPSIDHEDNKKKSKTRTKIFVVAFKT